MHSGSTELCLTVQVLLWLEARKKKRKKSVELDASLAPAEAGFGAVAKADQ